MTATATSLLPTALAYLAAGRSVLPIGPGNKRPSVINDRGQVVGLDPWKQFQTTPADAAQIRQWFPPDQLMGLGIACGPVSGVTRDGVTYGLEILDVDDDAENLNAFIEAVNFQGYSELLQRLLHQRTPGGAGHFAYLCRTWSGSTVLARRLGDEAMKEPKVVTLIETRGEGGQAVVAPTPPGIHPECPQLGYVLVRGDWTDLPIITPEEREALWATASSLNTCIVPERVHTARGAGRPGGSGNRPGDWLNRTADAAWWRELLERHGWCLLHTRGEIQYWQRPGKTGKAWSATWGACGEYFYVFSSNAAPFEGDRAYSAFSAYVLLDHHGDFQAAAHALLPLRFTSDYPEYATIVPLLERLVQSPDARLVTEALTDLVTLDRNGWSQAKHAIKGLLGKAINLLDLDAAWKKARRRPRLDPASSQTHEEAAVGAEAPASTIYITSNITTVVDTMQATLLQLPDAPRLFQRAQQLCHIARGVSAPKWLERSTDAPVIVSADPAYVRELGSQAASWLKYDKRADAWEDTLPPQWAVDTLLARRAWAFPLLEGVVTAPTLRPDGTLLDTPGYDPDTGLYFVSNGIAYPPLVTRPTLDDARTAIGILQDMFTNFLWVGIHHFSAALAAVLSLAARYAIRGNVPLFAVRATVRASGKGLLVDAACISATGRPAPRWPQVQEEEEERKRLLTIALDGDPCTHIDNVTKALGSPALDAALTASVFKDRILGKSESRQAPMRAVFFASGNNMIFKGDTARRVIPIDLDPVMERPEERRGFKHDPLPEWVQHEHPTLLAAALTILRAYFAADCPAQNISSFGSFEPWSNLIRQALIWSGEADPCDGRKDIEGESDPAFDQLATLLMRWQACYPKDQADQWPAVSLKTVLQDIGLYATPPSERGQPLNKWDDLRESLGALDPRYDGKGLRHTTISYKLRSWRGRVVEKRRLLNTGKDSDNSALWSVKMV